MSKVRLREGYRREDIKYMLHGATVPSEFAKSTNRIYAQGYGVKLIDIDGREYIDAMSSGFCACLGYGNQELAETAKLQMNKLHCCMSFLNRASLPEIDLATKLVEVTPAGIERFMFANSGSDANETAIKIVRWHWRERGQDKYKIISVENSYHGATYGAVSASTFSGLTRHKNLEPFLPGFVQVGSPYCYRCPFGKSYPGCDIDCAKALEEVIQREGEDTVGAFLAEPVGSSPGTLVPVPEYWPRVMEICKKYNILLIIDEYITGFGRMGKFFASENWDIRPDIVMFAKGLASGYMPIACVGITQKVYEGMTKTDTPFPHVYTYGGHPVSCAVALKTVEILQRENLIEKAAKTGIYLKERLTHIQKQSPYVGDVRGFGLFFCIELVADKASKKPFDPARKVSTAIRESLLEKGVMVGVLGLNSPNLMLAPPLVITRDELDYVLDGLEWGIKSFKP
jgi:adenosylmethionine-8-amino-7-oxononanoate aminotransferase